VKSVPACKNTYYKKKILFGTEVLLRQRTFVLNSYVSVVVVMAAVRSVV
jgi:hypothetical protein